MRFLSYCENCKGRKAILDADGNVASFTKERRSFIIKKRVYENVKGVTGGIMRSVSLLCGNCYKHINAQVPKNE